MFVMTIYTTTNTRLIRTNNLVFLGLITLVLGCGIWLVPLGCIRLSTLAALVTLWLLVLVSFPIIIFLRIRGISRALLCIHLAFRRQWLLWHRLGMHRRWGRLC